MTPDPATTIDEMAARWLARMVSGHASEEDRASLTLWLEADSRHKGAYMRAMALWRMLDGAAQAPALPTAHAVLPVRNRVHPRLTRRRMLGGAGAMAASVAGALVLRNYLRDEQQILQTGRGEVREFALSDGSHIVLDSGSRVDVTMRRDARDVALVEGTGWFHVAKDKTRPFTVSANGARFVAVGTAFSVSREGATRIVVSEGIVRMTAADHARAIDLHRNETAMIDRAGGLKLARLSDDAMNRQMAWREGSVGLDGETLREAADSFNRYNRTQIVIVDPALGDKRVIGWFSRGDPQGFALAAATMLDAKVDRQGETIRLMKK
ncbi:transmembrane sensor [Novosphingobium sp. SG751A]|uniref:FecR family protein n=1 Tax=Novosphingobium sp. SG751A TaxID=2587000 RepID=UPI0015569CF8|nr:FecR domain-containing protein [Novosphingobium sp. SG751A]NOW47995.1 transmembrane sensor [Novosphingobium sp. SG751A]